MSSRSFARDVAARLGIEPISVEHRGSGHLRLVWQRQDRRNIAMFISATPSARRAVLNATAVGRRLEKMQAPVLEPLEAAGEAAPAATPGRLRQPPRPARRRHYEAGTSYVPLPPASPGSSKPSRSERKAGSVDPYKQAVTETAAACERLKKALRTRPRDLPLRFFTKHSRVRNWRARLTIVAFCGPELESPAFAAAAIWIARTPVEIVEIGPLINEVCELARAITEEILENDEDLTQLVFDALEWLRVRRLAENAMSQMTPLDTALAKMKDPKSRENLN